MLIQGNTVCENQWPALSGLFSSTEKGLHQYHGVQWFDSHTRVIFLVCPFCSFKRCINKYMYDDLRSFNSLPVSSFMCFPYIQLFQCLPFILSNSISWLVSSIILIVMVVVMVMVFIHIVIVIVIVIMMKMGSTPIQAWIFQTFFWQLPKLHLWLRWSTSFH